MRKIVTLILCALLTFAQVWAQTRTVTGKITEQKTGSPLIGVTVSAGSASTLTDASGVYRINVPSGVSTLVFTFVGYERMSMPIGTSNTVNAALSADTKALEEVVVTGYSSQKRSQFAGAATIISSKAVETVPVGSFDQALQGRAPGMLVNSGSGQPGTSPTITIRGVQSIQGAGAQPLFVIDGVPAPALDFQTINPNDFESITILKDANAAALYGARGGTGVVVITTKRGKAGATNFTFRTQAGFTNPPSFERLNLMNTREMLAYEEREKLAGTPGWVYSPLNPAIPTGMTAQRKQQILDSISMIDIDYADIFYRQGFTQNHELNMSGGNEKTRFFMSAGMFDQEGIDLGSELKRYTTRMNLDHTHNKLSIQFNALVGYSKTKLSEGEALGNSPRNPFQMTYRAKTYENPYNPNGTLNFGASTPLALKQVANLLEGIEHSRWMQDQLKLNGGVTAAYRIAPTLTLKHTLGADVSNDQFSRYIDADSYIGSLQTFQSGLAQEASRTVSQFINTSSLVYANRFADKHDVEVGGYFETVRGYSKSLGLTLFNLDKRLTNTGQGAGALPVSTGQTTYPQNSSSAKSGFGIRSYFATLKYTFDGKYSFNANVRNDATSRIVNEDNREITTWSAGFIWNALQERFLSTQRIFTDLRLRATYGIVPNIGSIPTGSYGVPLAGVTNYQGPQVPQFGTTNYAGSTVTGLAPTSPGNPDLKIERIHKTNIGLDLAVWNNRARFSVDVYKNKTVDLFVSQPLSGTTGFGTLSINAGIMTNKGVEFTANVDVIRSKNFGFNISANHSINKNNIEDLGLVNEYFLGTFVIREGLPYGSHYTYNYLGADPATGRPTYETQDGKTTNNLAQAGRFAKFGTYLPKHQGGTTFEVRFQSITLSALFSYQFDVIRSNNTRNWITRGTPGYHQAVRASRELIDGQWQKAGDNKFYQSSLYDRDFTSSDLEDAKFLRLRNLNLAYQLPELKMGSGRTIIKGGRFYLQGQNLAIWSPWRGVDPEDNNNISLNEYPNPKAFVVGLDINF